jgi:hypothetical protein
MFSKQLQPNMNEFVSISWILLSFIMSPLNDIEDQRLLTLSHQWDLNKSLPNHHPKRILQFVICWLLVGKFKDFTFFHYEPFWSGKKHILIKLSVIDEC